MLNERRILVIGSEGQIGTELMWAIGNRWPDCFLVGADLKQKQSGAWVFVQLDAMRAGELLEVVSEYRINTVFLLAALLSATGEQAPDLAWELNMQSLFHVLKMARDGYIRQVFWPSSIAVFGPTTPRDNAAQSTVCEPRTVYGISKYAGELWCQWYHQKFGVDVRSVRYPGLIGYNALPGGGTTDYAVDIFHKAVRGESFTCFLAPDARLPMMFMPDAVRATLEIMDVPAERLSTRMAYNIGAFSFSPQELAAAIQRHKPDFQISYAPDYRQKIAESWPAVVDDSLARADWGWQPEYELEDMVRVMLWELEKKQVSPSEG
ncbi:MAG: NAD-dependent epimerase/dehydratase family protein [Flavobacteriales bacterium]|nr:NAD-dependent epimerase/dehydratase family protein [Flavobacteriales bacterium]MCX7650400.1 NAD-dependent epimerase/dehydratase family protein [Flavobacteriales bacterium]MDW8433081.1 NAD-dependent epimerase/dehydratase family protein [Flavobacteriales bacterium]